MLRNPSAGLIFLIFCVVICVTAGYSDDTFVWNLLKRKVAANLLHPGVTKGNGVTRIVRKSSDSVGVLDGQDEKSGESSRQYGYGHGAYNRGGGYDIYSLIAVAGFAALFGALFFELLGGSLRRSMGSSNLNLPFNFDSEKIPEIVSKISEWVSNSPWFENISGGKSRTVREVRENKSGLSPWIQAYRRDPVQFQCIRKLACETLADSPLAARSMKSQLGGIVIKTLGRFMNNGPELLNVVEETVGNPESCNAIVPYGFCETDNSSNEKQIHHFR